MPSNPWFTTAILVAALTSPPLGQTGPPSTSPFRDSVAREASRLAGQTAKAAGPAEGWSRVRSLRPGERIQVTLSGAPTLQRSFLAADDATMTVLNHSNPVLPEGTGRALRRLAGTNPRALLILAAGGTLRLDRLRIDPGGVFLGDSRLADVSSIVELHSQKEVVEIAVTEWRARRRFWRHLLGWPGAIGLGGGVGVASHACETRTPCSVSRRTLAISGVAGALAMAFAARHEDRRTPDGIVYRRPD